MKTITRRITGTFLALMLVMLGMLAAPASVYAANNGPAGDLYAWLKVKDDTDSNEYYFYDEGDLYDAVEGASYDLASNTLTLTDYDHPDYLLLANMMGDDFRIKVEGNCALSQIRVWGDAYGGNLTITGSGTLTVNEAKTSDIGILLDAEGCNVYLHVDTTVTLNVYGNEYAVAIEDSAGASAAEAVKVGDQSAGAVKTYENTEYEYYEMIYGYSEDIGIYSSFMVGTDASGNKYAVWPYGSSPGIFTYSESNKTTYNDKEYYVLTQTDGVNWMDLQPVGYGDSQTIYYYALDLKEWHTTAVVNAADSPKVNAADPPKVKAANPLTIKAKTATVKYSKLKKKAQTLAVTKVINFTNQTNDSKTYTLLSAKKGSKSFKKYFKINKTTGKVTVKKRLKKGTYKVKVKVKAAGNVNYKPSAVKTVTFTVKVK